MSAFFRPSELLYAFQGNEDEAFSSQVDSVFKFKYVPVHHFKRIVKEVQRNRIRKEEGYAWMSFVERNSTASKYVDLARFKDNNIPSETPKKEDSACSAFQRNSRGVGAKSPSNMDTELKRLHEDNAALMRSEPEPTNKDGSLLVMNSKDILADHAMEKHLFSDGEIDREYNRDLCPENADVDTSPSRNTYRNPLNGFTYTRPNPQATYKILMMQRRVVELLDEISSRLSRIPSPDSDNDLKRRQRCVIEFAARFTRNYLYNLTRCVADARRHAHSALASVKVATNRRLLALHMRAVEQNLIDAYQLLLHALIAYCKHIPCSVLEGSPGKLEDILHIVATLQNICEKTRLNTTYFGAGDVDASSVRRDMLGRCAEILRKLRAKSGKRPSIASGACSLAARNKERSNSHKSKSNVGRYSMYRENTDRNRSKCQRRGKVDVRRTRKPIVASSAIEDDNAEVSTDGRSEVVLRNGTIRRRTLQNEDDIKTTMSMLTVDSDERIELESRDSRMKPTERNTHPNAHVGDSNNLGRPGSPSNHGEYLNPKESFAATERHLESIVPAVADLLCLMKGECETQRIPSLSVPSESVIGIPQRDDGTRCASTSANIAQRASFVHGMTFGKIGRCTDNSSLIRPSSNRSALSDGCSRYCELSGDAGYENIEAALQPVVQGRRNEEKPAAAKPAIRLSIPEKARNRIVSYRIEYQRLAELKSMYASNTENKPWEIVAWISDKLVDELIADTAKELEMNEVIQKLLDLEFRDG